jgi:hypothetical protein
LCIVPDGALGQPRTVLDLGCELARWSPEMTLNPPRQLFFIIAVVIAIIAVISAFIDTFAFIPNTGFWLMTLAFVILALACIMKGA